MAQPTDKLIAELMQVHNGHSDEGASTFSDAAQRLTEQSAEIERLKTKYEDLIYCVSQKFKDETRHQTAKRYLLSWEGRSEAVEAPKDTP